MQAVILAGGKGTRLRPLTDKVPKPLLPIGNKPILEVIIERLRTHNFRDIILTVAYKAELIEDYFHSGDKLDVNITYFREDKPSGTCGPLKLVECVLTDQPFLTLNGDILTDIDFSKMYQAHLCTKAELTMATTVHTVKSPYGVVDLSDNIIVSIREKPDLHFLINAGIYIISPSALDIVSKGEYFDMPDLVQTLIDQGRHVETYHINSEWYDLGTMETYEKINALVKRGDVSFLDN